MCATQARGVFANEQPAAAAAAAAAAMAASVQDPWQWQLHAAAAAATVIASFRRTACQVVCCSNGLHVASCNDETIE